MVVRLASLTIFYLLPCLQTQQMLAKGIIAIFGGGDISAARSLLDHLLLLPPERYALTYVDVNDNSPCERCRTAHVVMALLDSGALQCAWCFGINALLQDPQRLILALGVMHRRHLVRASKILSNPLLPPLKPTPRQPFPALVFPLDLLGLEDRKQRLTVETIGGWIESISSLETDLIDCDVGGTTGLSQAKLAQLALTAAHSGTYLKLHPLVGSSAVPPSGMAKFVMEARRRMGDVGFGLQALLHSASGNVLGTTLLLLHLKPNAKVTTDLHVDPLRAVNLALALDITMDLTAPLATWLFVNRSRARLALEILTSLRPDPTMPWTVGLLEEAVSRAHRAAAGTAACMTLVQQMAGDAVWVEQGDMHIVITHQPCVKIAWDFFDPSALDGILRVSSMRAMPGVGGQDFMASCHAIVECI